MREPLRLTLTAGPAQLPVTLGQVKAHLRLEDDFTIDDAPVMTLARTATEACERFTGRALITQTWTQFRDAWPVGRSSRTGSDWWDGVREGAISEIPPARRVLELPKPPLQSVIHIKTYDDADQATTYAVANYFVDSASDPGRIVLRDGAATPAPTRAANGLEVQIVAGYGDDPGNVPEQLRQGILMLTAHLYENRADVPDEAVKVSGAAVLWRTYRVHRL